MPRKQRPMPAIRFPLGIEAAKGSVRPAQRPQARATAALLRVSCAESCASSGESCTVSKDSVRGAEAAVVAMVSIDFSVAAEYQALQIGTMPQILGRLHDHVRHGESLVTYGCACTARMHSCERYIHRGGD
jgi:hypothetical protein